MSFTPQKRHDHLVLTSFMICALLCIEIYLANICGILYDNIHRPHISIVLDLDV